MSNPTVLRRDSLQPFSRPSLSTAELSADEGVLQVYDVLEEEYGHLDPRPAAEQQPRDWSVRPQHVLDLADFARKLCTAQGPVRVSVGARTTAAFDATREVSRALLGLTALRVGDDGAALRQAFERYAAADQPSHPLEAAFTEQLAGRINLLLEEAGLARQPGFATLQVDAYTDDLRDRERRKPAGRHHELNRLLFEAAFPSQLVKVRDIHLQQLYLRAHDRRFAALCLSGGGIRSATFGLGVVQGLARLGLLGRFHYMSTVSGGGYLGGWLSAWIMRGGTSHVIEALSGAPTEKLEPEPEPIRHLRAFSNFLSPRLGLLSADTWTLVATYLRNLWINWLVSVPLLAAVVMIPYAALAVVDSTPGEWGRSPAWHLPVLLAVLGGILAMMAVRFVHRSRPGGQDEARTGEAGTHVRATQEEFLAQCLIPFVLATVLLSTAWRLLLKWSLVADAPADASIPWLQGLGPVSDHLALVGFVLVGAAVHLGGWLIAGLGAAFSAGRWPRHLPSEFLGILATGVLAGSAAHLAADQFSVQSHDAVYVVFAMPVFLSVILLGSQLFLGLTSARSRDSEREWGARFNGWVLIVIASWTAFSWLILFAPALLAERGRGLGHSWLALLGGWSGVTTILLGRSASTDGKGRGATATVGDRVRAIALAVAAPLFAATIVILLSALDLEVIRGACRYLPVPCRDETHPAPWLVVALILFFGGVGLLFGRLIDTNRFSLHAMYRARLIRAYLGASRPPGERDPDPFTGFDEFDDLHMGELWPAAKPADHRLARSDAPRPPLHVVNVALNLVGGRNLAWQERKAESFTVTSLHAGSPFTGYRRTSQRPDSALDLEQRLYGGRDGLSLGTAMTISGAAANPNMGYHSSAAVTFLLTLFNARLGWWLGNPGPAGRHTYHRSSPRITAWQLMKELFGFTNDRAPYVQLSDGGHFDNLGLYEMVLRRCHHIVVVDSSCDPDSSYDDLGNAIRKIRIDLGVPIEFEDSADASCPPAGRYASTARIRYSCVDAPAETEPEYLDRLDGTLIYVKPALLGGEPRDVFTYKRQHPAFPNEATLDQFYTESQFESYRALGSHMIASFTPDAGKDAPGWGTLELLAEQVRRGAVAQVREGCP